MNVFIHRAKSRGYFDHGGLRTYHTFSFADYFNSRRMHFGALRVLNDDTLDGGEGFGLHAHHNMEIVTIPLHGTLSHIDNLGNEEAIRKGQIQVMSAGSGIRQSEYNKNPDKTVNFLQIWVVPDRLEVEPRYQEITVDDRLIPGQFNEIVSPYPGNGRSARIHQQAWFSMGGFGPGTEVAYPLKSGESEGVYLFVIDGEVSLQEDITLGPRDGIGLTDIRQLYFKTRSQAEILLIEVPPMKR